MGTAKPWGPWKGRLSLSGRWVVLPLAGEQVPGLLLPAHAAPWPALSLGELPGLCLCRFLASSSHPISEQR